MSQAISSSSLAALTTEQERIQCHFISNTHWDREWRYSAQRTRYMLVSMLDMLFDIFEKEPRFQSFHMDSQTLPIQDYLEARPEQEALVKKYVEAGKLVIGPWFCLPDEFIVGGESLIRAVVEQARIPVIKHYKGNCHIYVDRDADPVAPQVALVVGAGDQIRIAAEKMIQVIDARLHVALPIHYRPRRNAREIGEDAARCRIDGSAVAIHPDEQRQARFELPEISHRR